MLPTILIKCEDLGELNRIKYTNVMTGKSITVKPDHKTYLNSLLDYVHQFFLNKVLLNMCGYCHEHNRKILYILFKYEDITANRLDKLGLWE